MESKYYLIATFLFLMACDKGSDEPIDADASMLVGKWRATEAYISAGGPQYWVDVENGEEIEFYQNGTFSSNRFAECDSGVFYVAKNELLLDYECSGFSSQAENPEGFITYNLELYPGYFLLTPTSGPTCTEGCSYKYQNEP